jgi:hypothetical protein
MLKLLRSRLKWDRRRGYSWLDRLLEWLLEGFLEGLLEGFLEGLLEGFLEWFLEGFHWLGIRC